MTESANILGLSEPLRKAVTQKFQTAFKAKDIIFSDTHLSILRSRNGVPFQLRYCPALARKPNNADAVRKEQFTGPKIDPFADPPENLLVARIPGSNYSHNLVLNKYPVIDNHFIIATRPNKPQTGLLEEDDISLTYECIRAWDDSQANAKKLRLFGFFNSGEHSGASQPHRHLQFLPVEDMSGSETTNWGLLVDRMNTRAHPDLPLFHDPALPLLHFSTPLGRDSSSSDLFSKYLLLMKAALCASQSPEEVFNEKVALEDGGKAVISYNLAITSDRMAICSRSREAAMVPDAGPESLVAINGTILGGTLMVKDEVEWDILRNGPQVLDDMLRIIGFPPSTWHRVSSPMRL